MTNGSGAGAGRAAAAAGGLTDSAEQAGRQAVASTPFRVLRTVGLLAYGVVHVLAGRIALQIAWTGLTGGNDQQASSAPAVPGVGNRPRRYGHSGRTDGHRRPLSDPFAAHR